MTQIKSLEEQFTVVLHGGPQHGRIMQFPEPIDFIYLSYKDPYNHRPYTSEYKEEGIYMAGIWQFDFISTEVDDLDEEDFDEDTY